MLISEHITQGRKIYFMAMNFVYSIKYQFDIELDFEFCIEIDFQTVEMHIFILVSIPHIIFLGRSFWNLKKITLIKIGLKKVNLIEKITRRTTGARGYKFELFQSIFNYIKQFSRSILVYLGLFWTISVHLGLSQSISVYLSLSRSISVYPGLSQTILDYFRLSWTILDYL